MLYIKYFYQEHVKPEKATLFVSGIVLPRVKLVTRFTNKHLRRSSSVLFFSVFYLYKRYRSKPVLHV